MTPKTKGSATVTAEPLKNAGNWKIADENNYSGLCRCSQTNERGKNPERLFFGEFVGALGQLSLEGISV